MSARPAREDAFPLSKFHYPWTPLSASRRTQQRHQRRVQISRLANDAVDALNMLHRSFATSVPLSFSIHSSRDRLCQHIYERASVFVRRLASCESDDLYSSSLDFSQPHPYHSMPDVVPLVADLVSLPDTAGSVPLLDLLPADVRVQYATPFATILPLDKRSACSGPRFHGANSTEYRRLIGRMCRLGMLSFTHEPAVVNSVFAVRKDGGKQRLIIDARVSNLTFVDPPRVDLPSPEVTAQLCVPPRSKLFIAKVDLDNFYHRLVLPEWLQPFFALPPIPSSLVGLPGPDVLVYPCCRTLPMGWSHSVYVAQVAHEEVLRRSGFLPSDRLHLGGDFRLDRVRHQVYIDDLMCFGTSKDEVQARQDAYIAAVTRVGLAPKQSKIVRATSGRVECLGVEVDGSALSIGLSPRKLWDLVESTRSLVATGFCSGLELLRLVGRWIWALLPCRPALSVLGSVFTFVQKAGKRRFVLWRSVIRELNTLCGLAPLLVSFLEDRVFPWTLATDASETGLGVVATTDRVEPSDLGDSRWSDIVASRWRFPDHINVLEIRAVSAAVRWALKFPNSLGHRLHILSDSQVAIGALRKGRSSSPVLLRRLRSVAAWLLASGVRLLLSWIPSECNPADEPSRR